MRFAIATDVRSAPLPRYDKAFVARSRGPIWLRRALNWILSALKAESEREEPPIRIREFHEPDGTFLERLHLQQSDILRLYNQEAKTLLIGPAQLGEVESELRKSQVFGLGMEFLIGGQDGLKILGVEVVMVPWMDGVLLLPDWKKKP